jgi:hypothetical protein
VTGWVQPGEPLTRSPTPSDTKNRYFIGCPDDVPLPGVVMALFMLVSRSGKSVCVSSR